MLRVYVAGAYSASNVIDVLNNMRRGMRASTEVLLAGLAPFSPWLDYHFQLQLREGENLSVNDYYAYSMTWLEASDIVYVIPDWENSKGTIAEINRANMLDIPIVYNMEDLKRIAGDITFKKRIESNSTHDKAIDKMLGILDDKDKDQEFMMKL